MSGRPSTVGLIGFGAIGRQLCRLLSVGPKAVLVRRGHDNNRSVDEPERVHSLEQLLAQSPDVIVECAGHAAVAQHGPDILGAGKVLVIASVGALADTGLRQELTAAAAAGGGQMVVPAGALGAIDALAAASRASIASVCYRGTKPAAAWRGTPAEEKLNLKQLSEKSCFFQGNAIDAATHYPKNSNVAATVALAGIGFGQTQVELVADPHGKDNIHQLTVEADAVSFSLRLNGRPSPDNPKTSMLTALSIARAVQNHSAGMCI